MGGEAVRSFDGEVDGRIAANGKRGVAIHEQVVLIELDVHVVDRDVVLARLDKNLVVRITGVAPDHVPGATAWLAVELYPFMRDVVLGRFAKSGFRCADEQGDTCCGGGEHGAGANEREPHSDLFYILSNGAESNVISLQENMAPLKESLNYTGFEGKR